MQHFLDSQLVQWLQEYREILLPIFIIIAIATWALKLAIEHIKILEYLFPPSHKKIKRKIELLNHAIDFKEKAIIKVVEQQVKDEIFNSATGVFFRGKKRMLFTKLLEEIEGDFYIHELKLVQSYIVEKGNRLKMTSRFWTIGESIIYFLFFGTFLFLTVLLLILSYLNNHDSWVKLTMFFLIAIQSVFILRQGLKLAIAGRLRKVLN